MASGVISGAVKGVGEVAQAKKAAQGGTNSVYQGTDAEGKVRYVGITERDPNVRFNEHLNSGTNRAGLKYTPGTWDRKFTSHASPHNGTEFNK